MISFVLMGPLTGGLFIPPIIQTITGSSKVGKFEDVLKQMLVNVNAFLNIALIFMILILILAIYFSVKKIYSDWCRKKFKDLFLLLSMLDTEILLFKKIDFLKNTKKLEIKLSREETIGFIQQKLQEPFFIKKLGQHNCEAIYDGLDVVNENKLDIEKQMRLVENWAKLIEGHLI